MRNAFNDFRKPFQARGDFMWRGVAVVISHNIPREHVGDEVKPLMPHTIIQRLWNWFGWKVPAVMFVRGNRIEVDPIYQMQGKIFMSPANWTRMQHELARSAKTGKE